MERTKLLWKHFLILPNIPDGNVIGYVEICKLPEHYYYNHLLLLFRSFETKKFLLLLS